MNILIVDDNELNHYPLQVLLGRNGYTVVTAANGAEALEKARQSPPDLIVTDILMPVMDGFSLCREWKRDERLRDIPLVFYTGTYADAKDRELALNLGAARFIVKPESPETFLRTIKAAIADQKHGTPAAPQTLIQDEAVYLREHSEALIRKLENKMEQLEQAHRELERDLTERKRMEEALRESEGRLRSIIESSKDGMIFFDGNTRKILFGNDAMAESLQCSKEDLVDRSIQSLHPPEEWGKSIAQEFQRHVSGELSFSAGIPVLRNDGSVFCADISSSLIMLGGRSYCSAFFRDITARKQAEEALRASEARYRGLFDTRDSGIFLIECGTQRFLDVNATAVKLYGYDREEFLRMTAADISTDPDVTRRSIEAGDMHIPLRWHRRKDGTAFPVEITSSLAEYEGRRIHMAMVRDISRRQQREAAVRELSGRLMRLQDMERRRLARELHDTTAQELAAISMNIAVVRARASELSGDVRGILADTAELTDRCANEIRTMAYLLHPPVLEALGLAGTVRDYADGFARRSGIRVDLEISDELGRQSHERELALFRVLQESLANILHHSGSRTASVRLVRTADEVRLEVRDRGRGMKLAEGPTAEELPVNNLGVGILGMRERMRQLGGRLEINSGAQGTCVAAILPLGTQAMQP
jgi:PAS domain S-box-containing protein